MLTLSCLNKECMLRVRLGRVMSKPALQVGAFRYCPLCGGKACAGMDIEESYVETLAQSYQLPVDVMKMLLDTWDANEHSRFVDYLNELKKEVGLTI